MKRHPLAVALLALAAGAAAVAAWAPLAWWPLAPAAYGVLFGLLALGTRPLPAAWLGMLFGLGLHLTGHRWVYTVLTGPVGMGTLPAMLASAVVLMGLALFTALPCALQAIATGSATQQAASPLLRATLFASLMTMGEMARALVWDRFSSLSLGYALVDTWLAGWAPVLGAYGLSWLGYAMAAVTAQGLAARRHPAPRLAQGLLPLLVCLLAGLLLQAVRWTVPVATPVHFRLLQPNTRQADKFDPAFRERISRQVLDMVRAAPADLVVAPETAFPMYWNELPGGTLAALQDFATQSGSQLLFGIATVGSQSQGHNSMVQLQPGGAAVEHYDKVHLFPFGEYAPPGLGWITRELAIPLQDLGSGTGAQAPFTLRKGQYQLAIGSLICHENMLSDEARHWAPRVNLLINPGNMAWFDGTLAMAHALQITRMRALEVGRPILRVSNTGGTALILSSGAVAQELPAGQAVSLDGSVTGQSGWTPYVRWGDWPVGALCLLPVAATLLLARLNRPRRPPVRETAPRCSQTG